MPKGSQDGAKIDAKTHQKSMPKPDNEKDYEHHQKLCFSEKKGIGIHMFLKV